MKKKLASKVIAGVLTSAMVLGMAACGNDNQGNSSENSSGNSQSSTPDSGSSATTPENSGSASSENPGGGDSANTPISITVSLPGDNVLAEEGTDEHYLKLISEINAYANVNASFDIRLESTYSKQLVLRYAAQDVADVMRIYTDAVFWSACVGGGTYTVDEPEFDANGDPVMVDELDENGQPKKDENGNVIQVQKTNPVEVTVSDGLFWDLTDYIDDYDNLKTIPEATRAAASYNGRMYFIPLSRTLARNGVGFRKDWCEKLNLAFWNKIEAGEDPTWDDFYDMLYAFTYNDPDGNGLNDTCGLLLDQWMGQDMWNNVGVWFGAPNEWGIDENGDLVYKLMTDEYKAMLKAARQLYEDGLINDGSQSGVPAWYELGPGKSRNELQKSLGGASIQNLDYMRKIETTLEKDGVGGATEDAPIFWLNGYVTTESGNYEPHCYPTSGFSGGLAITKKNIKTEEQLKQVLQFINDMADGEAMNLIEYGWEGETYEIDEDGYVKLWLENDEEAKAKLEAAGVADTKYRNGFNQIICYYTAEENARPVETAPATGAIQIRENELYEADIPLTVPNYGASFYQTKTYVNDGAALDAIIYGTDQLTEGSRGCQLAYIMGEIDDAGLEAAINQWWAAGGEQWTKEINEAYHAAGN